MPTPDQTTDTQAPPRAPSLARAAAFLAIFACLIATFYGVTSTRFFQQDIFPRIKSANAHASGLILNAMGQNVRVHADTITARSCALSIERGCDATEPIALCAAALIAAGWRRWRRLLIALPLAVLTLLALNLVRIITLYFARTHAADSTFTTTHEAWQGAFAIAVVATWIIATAWTLRPAPQQPADADA